MKSDLQPPKNWAKFECLSTLATPRGDHMSSWTDENRSRMASTGQLVAWTILVLVLFVTTFGITSFLFVIALLISILSAIFLAIDKNTLINNSKRRYTFPFRRSYLQLLPCEDEACSSSQGTHSITGERRIDDEIESVLRLVYRDFVHSWYDQISTDEQFIHNLDSLVKQTLRNLSLKFRSIDTVSFLTTKLVDSFASHLRLYRLSLETQSTLKLEDPNVNLLSCFFDLELHQEEHHLCRDLVSEDNEYLFTYLTGLCDTLLYLLIPLDSFNNRLFHTFILSLFVNALAYPVINLLSNPDFVNRLIILLCSSRTNECITLESFLLIVKTSDSMDELSSLRESVENECTILRSRDTGGVDDQEIKQQLNSLAYLGNIITSRMKKLKDGSLAGDDDLASSSMSTTSMTDSAKYAEFKKNPGKLINLPFEVILKNNVALSHFIEYMSSIGSQGYIFFYLNVEAFKSSAEQTAIAAAEENSKVVDLEFLRSPAVNIYETYLCKDKLSSQKLVLNEEVVEKIRQRLIIKKESISEDLFDEVANVTFTIMRDRETFYPSFQRSIGYIKMLEDLDLLRLPATVSTESSDTTSGQSLEGDPSEESSDPFSTLEFLDMESGLSSAPVVKPWISAEIDSTGVVREFGTCYAVYAISVTLRRDCGKEERWCCLRRYSDFFTFHAETLTKYPQLARLTLPAKRTLASNLSQEFLEQRRHLLNGYLQQLVRILLNRKDLPNFKEHMLAFLQPVTYEKSDEKNIVTASVAKAVDKLVINPFKSVGDVVKSSSVQIKGKLSKLSSIGDTIKGTVGTVISQSSNDSGNGSRSNSISSQNSSGVGYTHGPNSHPGSGSNSANVQHLNVPSVPTLSTSASCSSIASSASGAVDSSKVASVLDLESEDNIPLRIMLLLMDEVFDLKSKNLWLRRRIIAVVRQLIHATSGDAINKRIVEKVEELTSPGSIASYIRSFKMTIWPLNKVNGEPNERNHSTKMVTRIVAKSCLISLVSDDLKHIIGSETSKRGILRVFAMFQNEILNRRLVIVLLESLLMELFPENKMKEIIVKLHSSSNRKGEGSTNQSMNGQQQQWPPFLSKFLSSTEEIKSLQEELRMVACSQASSIASVSSRGGSPVHLVQRK